MDDTEDGFIQLIEGETAIGLAFLREILKIKISWNMTDRERKKICLCLGSSNCISQRIVSTGNGGIFLGTASSVLSCFQKTIPGHVTLPRRAKPNTYCMTSFPLLQGANWVRRGYVSLCLLHIGSLCEACTCNHSHAHEGPLFRN